MTYSVDEIETALCEEAGELMVVLESDREYELHIHDTEFGDDGEITTEGMMNGEYKVVTFPASAIEHYYVHKAS